MVYIWALKGFLYPYFEVYVGAIMVLGPFGKDGLAFAELLDDVVAHSCHERATLTATWLRWNLHIKTHFTWRVYTSAVKGSYM